MAVPRRCVHWKGRCRRGAFVRAFPGTVRTDGCPRRNVPSNGSRLGVAATGAALCLVHTLVHLGVVLVAGALVDLLAGLLDALVDLLVVVVREILGPVHECHAGGMPTGRPAKRGARQ